MTEMKDVCVHPTPTPMPHMVIKPNRCEDQTPLNLNFQELQKPALCISSLPQCHPLLQIIFTYPSVERLNSTV